MPKRQKSDDAVGASAPTTQATVNGVTIDFAQMVAEALERTEADTYLEPALIALTSPDVTKALIVSGPDGLTVAKDRAKALVGQLAQVAREKYGLGNTISESVILEALIAELERVRKKRQQQQTYRAGTKDKAPKAEPGRLRKVHQASGETTTGKEAAEAGGGEKSRLGQHQMQLDEQQPPLETSKAAERRKKLLAKSYLTILEEDKPRMAEFEWQASKTTRGQFYVSTRNSRVEEIIDAAESRGVRFL